MILKTALWPCPRLHTGTAIFLDSIWRWNRKRFLVAYANGAPGRHGVFHIAVTCACCHMLVVAMVGAAN